MSANALQLAQNYTPEAAAETFLRIMDESGSDRGCCRSSAQKVSLMAGQQRCSVPSWNCEDERFV